MSDDDLSISFEDVQRLLADASGRRLLHVMESYQKEASRLLGEVARLQEELDQLRESASES